MSLWPIAFNDAAIKAFSSLYELGNAVTTKQDENLYACASVSNGEGAILVTHYNDDDSTASELVAVSVDGFTDFNGVRAEVYEISEKHDLTLVKEEIFTSENYSILLKQDLFTSYLIKLYKTN